MRHTSLTCVLLAFLKTSSVLASPGIRTSTRNVLPIAENPASSVEDHDGSAALNMRGLTVVEIPPSQAQDQDTSDTRLDSRGLTVVEIPSSPAQNLDNSESLDTRGITGAGTPAPLGAALERRKIGITHCGLGKSQWLPVESSGANIGFNDAAASFCNHFDGTVVAPKGKVQAMVKSSGDSIIRLTGGTIGHFEGT